MHGNEEEDEEEEEEEADFDDIDPESGWVNFGMPNFSTPCQSACLECFSIDLCRASVFLKRA